MIRDIIALSAMGIKNDKLIFLLQNCFCDIQRMFKDDAIFDERIELAEYKEYFTNEDLVEHSLKNADSILSGNKQNGIRTTYYTSDTYPKELAKIEDPPAIIYYKGAEFAEVSGHAIACVGTRKPSRFSYNAVNYLIPQWVDNGCSIISGLACGVDKLSHQSCISSGGRTVAVLAHGLDMIYPKENKELAERILAHGGILMSEYPVGTRADKYRFVDRNRLIVGMAKAVVIYECDIKGGTMHNAKFAAQQKKPVFCPKVGPDIMDIQTGTKKLIDDCIARVIEDGRDINGVLNVVGVLNVKPAMRSIAIKKIYLRAVIAILNKEIVLNATIQELDLPIQNDSSFYEKAMELIDNQIVTIDSLLNSLVQNNIASINKTLQFDD